MTPPAPKAGPTRRGGRRPTAPVRSSLRVARLPPEPQLESRRDRPHSLPPTNRSNPTPSQNTHSNKDRQLPSSTTNHGVPYPNAHEDPDPAEEDASPEEQEDRRKSIIQFGDEMYEAFKAVNNKGEELWMDFISTFRPHSIDMWPKGLTYKWCNFLRSGDVHIDNTRETSRSESLKRLLFRDVHIPTKPIVPSKEPSDGTAPHLEVTSSTPQPHNNDSFVIPCARQLGARQPPYRRTGDQGAASKEIQSRAFDSESEDEFEDDKGPHLQQRNIRTVSRNVYDADHRTMSHSQSYGRGDGLGIQGLMKSFQGKKTFSGSWEEDLDSTVSVYETMANMCQVGDEERLNAIPVMLSGDALIYYSSNVQGCSTYGEAITALRNWYNNSDKRARILTKWQSMRLTEEMSNDPNASEVEVFRKFVAKLMSLQKQLDQSYHDDKYLRDRLMTAVDIPSIQVALRDRIPRTAQQLANRIANRLSDIPRTAGSSLVHYAPSKETPTLNEAMYTLGQSYGGAARRSIKPFGNKGPNEGRRYVRGPSQTFSQKRLCPSWMRGVKGCFVCGENHLARQRHGREEVSRAIERLKERHPTALLTVEDLSVIYQMDETDDRNDETDDHVEWAEEEDNAVIYFAAEEGRKFEQHFAMSAFLHGRGLDPRNKGNGIPPGIKGKYNDTAFDGLRIDTCANRTSVISKCQYDAYCQTFNLPSIINPSKNKVIKGIGGCSTSVGIVIIQVPFKYLDVIIDISFLVIEEDVPTLLSMKDMLDNGLDISIQGKYVSLGERRHPLAMENYFLIHRWSPTDVPYALYTEQELRTLHRNFGHPSVRALQMMLERANSAKIDKNVVDNLEKIKEDCMVCKKTSSAPRRFKLTVGTSELRFNHRVQVDTMFIHGRPVLHMVDEATHFSAASFLRNQSTKEIWSQIQHMWSLVYLGPPDFLVVDQGSAYTSKEMRDSLDAQGIQLDEAPIETPGAIGTVERYHAPLRLAYERIRAEAGADTSDEQCLKLAVFAINCTVGPEGLCPILLVFGAVPRPARTIPAPTQLERARLIEYAMKEVEKEQARRRIAFGLRHKGHSKGKESSQLLRQLPAGSPVLVYRSRSKTWEGPFKFIQIEGETVVVQTNRGRKIFRSSCVKPLNKPEEGIFEDTIDETTDTFSGKETAEDGQHAVGIYASTQVIESTESQKTRPNGACMKISEEFERSRRDEIQGLMDSGTFELVDVDDIPNDTRIFGSRFIDTMKTLNNSIRYKSRLVAQNYGDRDSATIATKAPTVQRFSQRLVLSIAASFNDMSCHTRDITQAYTQSVTSLERDVYIRPPVELNLPKEKVLKVVKPLYGIPESGLHWYLTYMEHHTDRLGMSRSRADPCLLFRHDFDRLSAMVILQVDDSLIAGSQIFLTDEDSASKAFLSKPRQRIGRKAICFNGLEICEKEGGTLSINQRRKIDGLTVPTSEKGFRSQRALVQYIGVNCRPDVCATVQLIAPGKEGTTKSQFASLKRAVEHLKRRPEQGLDFVKLHMPSVRVVVISDASFANAPGLKSQLGFVILMADENRTANIVHYGSCRCHRVTRSVMASEVHALIHAVDIGMIVRDALNELLNRNVEMEAFVDSRTLFNVVTKNSNTAERRLQIDIFALRESYKNGELKRIGWIKGNENPADVLTKELLSDASPMSLLMKSNRFNVEPVGWAVRKGTD